MLNRREYLTGALAFAAGLAITTSASLLPAETALAQDTNGRDHNGQLNGHKAEPAEPGGRKQDDNPAPAISNDERNGAGSWPQPFQAIYDFLAGLFR